MKRRLTSLAAACLIALGAAHAGNFIPGYVPSEEIKEAQKQFSDNKFGIFIHWGIYSMIAHGEWFLNREGVTTHEYEKLAAGFYPSNFDAAEWVSVVKASGAKYICFTTRHHDSFSMFRTACSGYNIVDATPFGRDVLKELADECARQGIKLHLYYSHLDWRRDDYPLGRTGRTTGRTPGRENWDTYFSFMNCQLTELLTNYGPIGAIWFDGKWDHDADPGFDWHLDEQYSLIHTLQPSCLIANNHHEAPYAGENIQIFERDLPGENTAGLSGQEVSRLPLETCETMNGMWGYKITDQDYKSTRELIHLLVRAAGRGANLLLNVGPQPDGSLPDTAVIRLSEMGEWLKHYGETIYGTRAGDITPRPWGVTTRKGNRLFVHILDYQDREIFLPFTTARVREAVQFSGRRSLPFRQGPDGIYLRLGHTPSQQGDIDYVVELLLSE